MPKKDYRSEPVRRMVVIGESNAFGMCASDPRNEWVQTVANLIRDFQDEPLHLFNNAIPANVISPRSGLRKCWTERSAQRLGTCGRGPYFTST